FDQVLVLGEGRPYLVALTVLDQRRWHAFARELALDPEDPAALTDRLAEKAALARMSSSLRDFPGYAQIRRAHLATEPWTIDAGLMTPTLKPRRPQITRRFAAEIDALYD
ncbi:MAG: long-chain fatty acid--CoA ligase, partial [Gemmatimonadota bacterium]|nr:long-chain fatty acid--CoA ligase [Gemmatimonadota bacterium]